MPDAKASTAEATRPNERRDGERVAITLKVDYQRLNTFFADYTKNISKGGTFIRTTEPLEVGTEFSFVLTAPEIENTPIRLELIGQVTWVVTEASATETEPAGMGVRFICDDDERRRVEDFVAQLMRSSLGDHLTTKLLSPS